MLCSPTLSIAIYVHQQCASSCAVSHTTAELQHCGAGKLGPSWCVPSCCHAMAPHWRRGDKTVRMHVCSSSTACLRMRSRGSVFSLGCFWGVLHPPIVQMYPSISVSEASASPIRVMACKADLYSIMITKHVSTQQSIASDTRRG